MKTLYNNDCDQILDKINNKVLNNIRAQKYTKMVDRSLENKRKKINAKKKQMKKIFGEHYNYGYHPPNQKKMYRIQENRNTEIQRANRILLEKIRTIFARSGPKGIQYQYYQEDDSEQSQIQEQIKEVQRIKKTLKPKTLHPIQKQKIKTGHEHMITQNNNLIRNPTKKKYHTSQQRINKTKLEFSGLRQEQIPIRRNTQILLKKQTTKNRIKTLSKPQNPQANQQEPQLVDSQITHKPTNQLILHNGVVKISGITLSVKISIKNQQYRIIARDLSKNTSALRQTQIIKIPLKDYEIFCHYILESNHHNIFEYLIINPQTHFLQIKGFFRNQIEVMQAGDVMIFDNEKIEQQKQQNQIRQTQLSLCEQLTNKHISESRKGSKKQSEDWSFYDDDRLSAVHSKINNNKKNNRKFRDKAYSQNDF